VDFAGGNQSSDGGLLRRRQAERKLGVCRRLADAMPDCRDASRIRHAVFEMVMARRSSLEHTTTAQSRSGRIMYTDESQRPILVPRWVPG
jgi:hypothetical protein